MRSLSLRAAVLLCGIVVLFCLAGCGKNPAEQRAALVHEFSRRPPRDLPEFLSRLKTLDGVDADARSAARKWLEQHARSEAPGSPVVLAKFSVAEARALYALVGIYARTRYSAEMLAVLGEFIAIPTYRRDGVPPHQSPAMIAMGRALEQRARRLGLEFKNHDNRIFEVVLKGNSEEAFGIYTHADVVPALPFGWGLPDGTELQPFRMRVVDGKIYGRGSEDDKCSIVSALYAMHVARESGLPLRRTIRLLIETTEETGGEGIAWFKKKYELPAYNIVLDSSYPVVVAEKGFGSLRVRLPASAPPAAGRAQIVRVEGAPAINQIPGSALLELRFAAGTSVASEVLERARRTARDVDARFTVESSASADRMVLRINGISAHASQPQDGVNPLPVLLRVVSHLPESIPELKDDAFVRLARASDELFGVSYLGENLGVKFEHDFMGPLTFAVTQMRLIDAPKTSPAPGGEKNGLYVELGVNTRLPKGKTAAQLQSEVSAALGRYNQNVDLPLEWDFEQVDALYRDPQGAWIQTLLEIFEHTTGEKGRPISAAGATTARELPNGVNFGPAMPGDKYMGHSDNEFKRVSNFALDVQMFTEMLFRLGNLERME